MTEHRRTGSLATRHAGFAIGLAAAALWTAAAQAVDVSVPAYPGPAASQGDIQALQERLSRQQFQQQQQRNRQDERNTVPVLQPRQEVPRMKPGCQGQVYGNLPARC